MTVTCESQLEGTCTELPPTTNGTLHIVQDFVLAISLSRFHDLYLRNRGGVGDGLYTPVVRLTPFGFAWYPLHFPRVNFPVLP